MIRDYQAEAAALPINEFDTKWMHEFMWQTFLPWMVSGNALELGVFHGAWTGRIFKELVDVTAVDASAECLAAARERWPLVEFIHSTFETVQLDRQFDNVFLLHTLEHVDDPVALLRKCRDWMAPNGRLFVAVPNAMAASRQLAVRMGIVNAPEAVTPAEAAHGHKRTYRLETLRGDCESAGLVADESGGIFFKPMAGFQFDRALQSMVIDDRYMKACNSFGKRYPELCASVYFISRPS